MPCSGEGLPLSPLPVDSHCSSFAGLCLLDLLPGTSPGGGRLQQDGSQGEAGAQGFLETIFCL